MIVVIGEANLILHIKEGDFSSWSCPHCLVVAGS